MSRRTLAGALARLGGADVGALGYTSFSAFVTERVELGASWVRGLVALVQSPLDLVKRATAQGLVPLRDAVRAPAQVAPDEQLAWLQALAEPASEEVAEVLDRLEGDEAATVREARRLGRILMGHRATNADVDAFLVDIHERGVPLQELLAAAMERPARPPQPEPVDWAWCGHDTPAESVLGPWREPVDIHDAADQLDAVRAIKGARDAVVARAWAVADYLAVWAQLGYDDRWAFAREVFGWPKRTAQRRKAVGWALEWHPELDAAVRSGLGLGAAGLLATVIDGDATRWLRVARRIGKRELARAVEAARHSARPSDVLERYERAIDDADAWVDEVPQRRAPPAGGPLRVALAWPEVPRTPGEPPAGLWAGPSVLAAARWCVGHIQLPKRKGFRAVAARDGFRCQNPECGRLTLRCECHHIVHVQHGGSDELHNGVAACRPCHLRGLHTGGPGGTPNVDTEAVEVAGRAALLWSYVGGRRVLQFR